MPSNESSKQVPSGTNGLAVIAEVPSRGTAQSQDKDISKVVSTPKKPSPVSQTKPRGEGLWRVPFLV